MLNSFYQQCAIADLNVEIMDKVLDNQSLNIRMFLLGNRRGKICFPAPEIYGVSYDDISRMGLTDWNKREEKCSSLVLVTFPLNNQNHE